MSPFLFGASACFPGRFHAALQAVSCFCTSPRRLNRVNFSMDDAVGTTRGVQKYFACKNRENTPHTSVSTALGRRVAGGSRCMRSDSVSVDMVVLLVPSGHLWLVPLPAGRPRKGVSKRTGAFKVTTAVESRQTHAAGLVHTIRRAAIPHPVIRCLLHDLDVTGGLADGVLAVWYIKDFATPLLRPPAAQMRGFGGFGGWGPQVEK